MKPRGKGPAFTRFLKPIIQVLREIGGSGTASEVIDRVIEVLKIPEHQQEEELKSGASRVRNQVQWARLYLVHGGFLDSSGRGIWRLTEHGRTTDLDRFDPLSLFREVARKFHPSRKPKETTDALIDDDDSAVSEEADYKMTLLEIIRSLPPSGFERLCQRLLRESGFQEVVVTGRSGDGGIDGIGVLQVTPFVSFNVLFQCKRYRGAVTPSNVRDFRGAMMGRADKGIILTTGTFTVEARKEARRDGVPPIELVAGEDLVHLFETLELGLKPRKTFDIEDSFFDEFRRDEVTRITVAAVPSQQ